MPSNKRIVGYLSDEDYELFKKAKKEYDKDESELIREVIHQWLFSIKLNLQHKK